jgi:hypothetical protein
MILSRMGWRTGEPDLGRAGSTPNSPYEAPLEVGEGRTHVPHETVLVATS